MAKEKIVAKKKDKQDDAFDLVCKRCDYKWLYQGHSDWYTSCPRCKGTVSVRNAKKNLGVKVD